MKLETIQTYAARILPIALLCIIAFSLSHYYAIQLPAFDDNDIILPALNHIKGVPYPALKYQPFPYMFYEFFFRLLMPLHITAEPVAIGKFINTILFSANVLLFYFVACRFMERPWAYLACALFLLAPSVFYSGLVVKTESLLLAELFISLICSLQIMDNPGKTRWHVLAAISSAMSVTTKYNVYPVVIYLSSLYLTSSGRTGATLKDRLLLIVRNRNVWIFSVLIVVVVFLIWPNIVHVMNFITTNTDDLYFNPNPSIFRAVDEFLSVPYGKFSYAVCIIIPFACGMSNYLFGLIAIPSRIIPVRLLVVAGLYMLLYCGVVQSVTLLRVPYLFTPVVPFFILFSTLFLRFFFNPGKKLYLKIIGGTLIAVSLTLSVLQFNSIYLIMKNMLDAIIRSLRSNPGTICLVHSQFANKQHVNSADIEGSINTIKPPSILVLDSFFYNYRKYRNPVYKKQYEYFEKLKAGEAGYTAVWQLDTDITLKKIYFDPEFSLRYTFYRRNEIAGKK